MRSRVALSQALLFLALTLPAAAEDDRKLSFRHDVLPVLSKAGCNGGGCHGALAGKGGFRLSLNAYDPATDHYNITRENRGRRIEFAAPASSLFVTKPTAAVRHKGGKVLHENSEAYRILTRWIQQGAPGPSYGDPTIERVEMSPTLSQLKKGQAQQLTVRAFFSDGTERDVTRWARFASTDATVAEVDEATGLAKVIGHGEGAVTAWYSGQIALARITSPWPSDIPDEVYSQTPRRNVIDDAVLGQLRRLNLKPSPRSSDSEFIRRVHLDVVGMLPTPEVTRAFLADPSETKRDAMIESLLAQPEFVDYWTYRLSDLFLISGRKLRPDALKSYYQWLRGEMETGTPWDQIVRQVVSARGDTMKNGATNFYSVHQDPETMAENVSQAFMSLSINCAKCHNHPLEKWTNDQYYSFANLFARVRAKGWGGDARSGNGARTLFIANRGDLIQPRTGKPQPPAPLDGQAIESDSPEDRREALAEWLTAPENPYFTRSIANRVWANFFGRGIVEPVDDLRVSNPASNEPLLEAISAHLVENRYDLKALMRLILQSETYQRTSAPLPENMGDQKYYSRYYPRRLMAEVLQDAITSVTRISPKYDKITLADGSTQGTNFYRDGTRALQLFDSSVTSYFLKTFGRNEREITCECERSNKPSMVQVLHLSNGDTLNSNLRSEQSCVNVMIPQSDEEIIEETYLLCLSRPPSDGERKRLIAMFDSTPEKERRAAIEDLFWALMTSREFLFQH
ncbi:MAG TPA: S-layer protein [Verrucomicrobiales bacterium]|nr:S-layer protein [Verrucomicrobiales bacterium]